MTRGGRRPPAPIGVPTAARVHLLREVAAGRVIWLIPAAEALSRPRNSDPYNCTARFNELVRSGWAYVEPWNAEADPPPVESECRPTAAGVALLIQRHK